MDKMLYIEADRVDGSAYFYWSYTDGITHADACRTSAKPWVPYKRSYVCENVNFINPSRLLYMLFTPETITVGLWTGPVRVSGPDYYELWQNPNNTKLASVSDTTEVTPITPLAGDEIIVKFVSHATGNSTTGDE
jgi:hypothetical protein